MTLLTAEEIKTALETIEFSYPIKRINSYSEQNESRRSYPSIDIINITGEESSEAPPLITTKQTYQINLYWKTKGRGSADEPKIKIIEDQIFNKVDELQTPTTKVSITQGWSRRSEAETIVRTISALKVSTEEISATDDGIRGDRVSLTLPSPVGSLDVLSVINDSSEVIETEDLALSSVRIFTRIRRGGILSVTISVPLDKQQEIRALIFSAKDVSVSITLGTQAESRLVNLSSLTSSGDRKEVLSQILSMDVKY